MKKQQNEIRLFAGSGSCFDRPYAIYGRVEGISFTSEEFSGTMDGQKFWDDLATFAKSKGKFIELYSM